MSNPEEVHSFLLGFFEILCPWKPRYPMTSQAEFTPNKEYHYYLAGRALGFPLLVLILIALAKLTLEVLL